MKVTLKDRILDTLFKVKCLFTIFLTSAFDDWKTNLWRKDLDSFYCCNGRECGCYGTTYRELYQRRMKTK